ncbi:MAG: topoisomerase C-terminal repeat-containing protein, partial [Myxococcota bacterium]|nr:topoisomerase C-terminal repeat-containing protein [Myxococcota bacterium]
TEAGLKIVETSVRWVDAEHLEGAGRPKGVLPKVVCKRDISNEEAERFFTEGSTEFLDNFISKRGRPFRAKLILKSNGRHGFEFEARRKGRGKKRKAADGEEAETPKAGATPTS